MTQKLVKNWWLLAICAILDAAYSAMNFFMQLPDGSLAFRTFVSYRMTIEQMGMLALAAGVCMIAATVSTFKGSRVWLLLPHGLACSTLGLIFIFWTGRLAFRTIALLLVMMALSGAIYGFTATRKGEPHLAEKWLLHLAGTVSIGFAFVFLALGFGWIKLSPGSPAQTFHWIGSYFAFSAVSILALALRPPDRSRSSSSPWQSLPSLANPKLAQ